MSHNHDLKQGSTALALRVFSSNHHEFQTHFWEFFSLIAMGDLQFSKKLYQHLEKIQSPCWQTALVEIGRAKLLSVSGKILESHLKLQAISDSIYLNCIYPSKTIENEIFAFLYYEKAALALKTGNNSLGRDYLQTGKKLTSLTNFLLAFELQIELCKARKSPNNLPQVDQIIEKLEDRDLLPLACLGLRNAGVISKNASHYSQAHSYYNKALDLAENINLNLIKDQITIAQSALYLKLGDPNKARDVLRKIETSEFGNPMISHRYEILATIEYREGNLPLSIDHIKRAININTHSDCLFLVPGEYEYLGRIYETHYRDLEQAEYYYKQGYDHSMHFAGHGIRLTGDRKNVVDAYVRLIEQKSKSSTLKGPQPFPDPFAFAQGRPWRDIKDVFQHQLISYHRHANLSSKSLAEKLELPTSTLYALQDRLKKRGYLISIGQNSHTSEVHDLHNFIVKHQDLTWAEANQIFEKEIIQYLYQKYGYNKHRMARILGLSYPTIINKTRKLTQSHEYFLPN